MYWLTSEFGVIPSDDQQETVASIPVALPCPSVDLVDLVASVAWGEEEFFGRLRYQLRTCPSFQLFALACYYQEHGQAAKCARSLIVWCRDNILESLRKGCRRSAPEGSRFHRVDQSFWPSFLRVKKQKLLKKAFRCWLQHHTNLTSSEQKELLDAVLCRSFNPAHFGRHNLRVDKLEQRWEEGSANTPDLQAIIQLSEISRESDREFSERLQEQKLSAMKQLAYGASHEINNPLANIAMRAQALLTNDFEPQNQRRISIIYQQAMRAHEMISDLMLFARPPELLLKRVSLRMAMRRISEQWSEQFSNEGIAFRICFAIADDYVQLDQTQILVAIGCLLKNSQEAIAAKPGSQHEIEVRLESDDEGLIISVRDTGVGVPGHIQPHLFDPFFSGREAGRGLGFGLSKVWRIVQMHGGTVCHKHSESHGTRFEIRLPMENSRAPKKSDAEIETSDHLFRLGSTDHSRRKRRIA